MSSFSAIVSLAVWVHGLCGLHLPSTGILRAVYWWVVFLRVVCNE